MKLNESGSNDEYLFIHYDLRPRLLPKELNLNVKVSEPEALYSHAFFSVTSFS